MGASCFKCTDSVKIFDMNRFCSNLRHVAGWYDYLKPKGTITAEFVKKMAFRF